MVIMFVLSIVWMIASMAWVFTKGIDLSIQGNGWPCGIVSFLAFVPFVIVLVMLVSQPTEPCPHGTGTIMAKEQFHNGKTKSYYITVREADTGQECRVSVRGSTFNYFHEGEIVRDLSEM